MAANKLGGSHLVAYRFQKGQSGNPNGSREYNNRRRVAKEVSTECLERISHALFDGSLDELKALQQAEDVTPIERLCIAVVVKAYEKGDAVALNILMDRFLGKVKEKVEVMRGPDATNPTLNSMTDEELAKREAALVDAGL